VLIGVFCPSPCRQCWTTEAPWTSHCAVALENLDGGPQRLLVLSARSYDPLLPVSLLKTPPERGFRSRESGKESGGERGRVPRSHSSSQKSITRAEEVGVTLRTQELPSPLIRLLSGLLEGLHVRAGSRPRPHLVYSRSRVLRCGDRPRAGACHLQSEGRFPEQRG